MTWDLICNRDGDSAQTIPETKFKVKNLNYARDTCTPLHEDSVIFVHHDDARDMRSLYDYMKALRAVKEAPIKITREEHDRLFCTEQDQRAFDDQVPAVSSISLHLSCPSSTNRDARAKEGGCRSGSLIRGAQVVYSNDKGEDALGTITNVIDVDDSIYIELNKMSSSPRASSG